MTARWPPAGLTENESGGGNGNHRGRAVLVGALLAVCLLTAGAVWWRSREQAVDPAVVQVAAHCRTPDGACVYFRQAAHHGDGAPLPRGTLIIVLTAPVRTPQPSTALHAVSAAFNLETREPHLILIPVRALTSDPTNPRQLLVELDGLPADGTALELPAGMLQTRGGAPIPALSVSVRTRFTPFETTLAGITWEPTEPGLFSNEGTRAPRGAKAEDAVRRELEGRLRIRPGIKDDQVGAVLARYDDPAVKQKAPDHRVRAGLLLLTGTTGEHTVEYLLNDTPRNRVPFAPIAVLPIADYGAFAAVIYPVGAPHLQMIIDTEMAADALENIAVAIAHEAVHSGLGEASASQEALAMAMSTRVYEELLLFDPSLARTPTSFTRQVNLLTLALRNSGRFGFPKAGILQRPDVTDAIAGSGDVAAGSLKDVLFHPGFYGDLRRGGDAGTEVLETYYKLLSGDNGDRGRIPYDERALKLFDEVLDNGLSEQQILAIADALRLRPVPLPR